MLCEPAAWCGRSFLTEGEKGVLSVCSLFFDRIVSVRGCMCAYELTHTHTLHVGYSDVSPGVDSETRHLKISSRLPAYIYTCVLCTHVRIHICRDLVHLECSGPVGVTSRTLGSHRLPHVQCVRVCAYTHIHTHTLPPASNIEKKQDNTHISPSVKNNSPCEATRVLHRLADIQ